MVCLVWLAISMSCKVMSMETGVHIQMRFWYFVVLICISHGTHAK